MCDLVPSADFEHGLILLFSEVTFCVDLHVVAQIPSFSTTYGTFEMTAPTVDAGLTTHLPST